MMLAWCLCYVGIITLVGAAITGTLLQHQRRSIPELAGLILMLGAGSCGVLLIWISMLGVRPARGVLILLAIIAAAVLVVLKVRRKLPAPTLPQWDRSRREILILAPILVLLLANLSILIPSFGFDIFEWDAFSIWGLKAKVLYHSALTPRPPYFMDVRLTFSHLDYPLLVPMLTAGGYSMMGQVDDRLGKIILPLILAGQTLLAYSAARMWLGRLGSLVATMLLICMPVNLAFAGMGVADVALATFWLGSLSYLLRWMHSRNHGDAIIAALFALFTAMTKAEGLPLALMSLLAICIVSATRRTWKDALCFGLIVIAGIGIWLIWRMGIPRTDENYLGRLRPAVLAENFSRLSTIISALMGSFIRVDRWGGLWLLLPLIAVLGYRAFAQSQTRILWAMLAGHLMLYALAYVISPWQDLDALITSSLERLLLHIAPAAIMLIAIHWSHVGAPRTSLGAV